MQQNAIGALNRQKLDFFSGAFDLFQGNRLDNWFYSGFVF
jgi:hypothetical protein